MSRVINKLLNLRRVEEFYVLHEGEKEPEILPYRAALHRVVDWTGYFRIEKHLHRGFSLNGTPMQREVKILKEFSPTT